MHQQHRGRCKSTTHVWWPCTDVAVVALGGEHDLSTAEQLDTTFSETLQWCSQLIVDLRDTGFVDSSTIRVLLSAKGSADAAGRQFNILLATTPAVERAIEITGLLEVLNRVHTLEQALARVAG